MDQTVWLFGAILLISMLLITLIGLPSTKRITVNGTPLWVEVADTPLKKTVGLMFRTRLPEGTGMLFTFSDEQPRRFWMLFTVIPLEAIHVDSKGKIVKIIKMEPCTSLHCPTYPSDAPAMYVIEVPSGYSAKHGVQIGQKIEGL